MKRTVDGCRAHQLETIVVPKSEENVRRDRCIYCIDDSPGLYLRLTNEQHVPEGTPSVSAWFGGAVYPFIRATKIEAELKEASQESETHNET